MAGLDGPGDGTPSIESLRELRLRALLKDLVADQGPGKAAERLGVDRKTLWRWQRAALLPPRLAETLERMLLERAVAASGEDRERVRALEERVAELEGELRQVLAAGSDSPPGAVDGLAVEALREEWAEGLRRLERRVEGLESARGAGLRGGGGRRGRPRSGEERRHPDVVAWAPAGDDPEVYGAACPLVREWRELWMEHQPVGNGLAWVRVRQRILELEVALLVEHGLTLPLETAPLRGLDRNEQLSWRQRELAAVRRRRARLERLRWLRGVLTLGLWRR